MNNFFRLVIIFFLSILLIGCWSNNKNPEPSEISINPETIIQDSLNHLPPNQFYELEESIEDISRQIAQLQSQVSEYDYLHSNINYTEKLKKLIDEPQPAHKITLKNGSVIEGTIETDLINNIEVKTELGKLTIEKKEIEYIEDLVLPAPQIVFIGNGQEQVFDSYHLFMGKVLNQGGLRGDFVRVIYQLWGEDTKIISSDSAFVAGTQVIYNSGIITDTALEPNQSAHFSVQVPVDVEIPISYVTREVHWLLYD